jgi:DNA polymerase/3'-5' exonuclease PolX
VGKPQKIYIDLVKERFPADEARAVADAVVGHLLDAVYRITVAGSLRRGKKEVGDIEILYIPKPAKPVFGEPADSISRVLARLEKQNVLEPRRNISGRKAMGQQIKLLRHCDTGIPVDLFATDFASWWNYLVCRTGGAEHNKRIASLAKEAGFKWEPYSAGFYNPRTNTTIPMQSEKDVFAFLNIPYLRPENRP